MLDRRAYTMAPSDQLEPRWQIAVLVVAGLLPLAIAFVCSYLLSGNPIVKVAYTIAKVVQLGFPLVWIIAVERRALRFGRPTTAALLPAVVSGVVLCLLVLAVYAVGFRAELRGSDVPEILRTKLGGYGIVARPTFAVFAAYHVVLNAFAEEYYWRWFFFARLRALMSSTAAIVLSSLVFTLHHAFAAWWNGSPGGTLVAASLLVAASGAVWARLYERSGTIFPSWLSHMLAEIGLVAVAYDLWRA